MKEKSVFFKMGWQIGISLRRGMVPISTILVGFAVKCVWVYLFKIIHNAEITLPDPDMIFEPQIL
ncbi:MAG: hypothetical protein GYA34_12020 [Chloroflexi bacterium]|nr:hypothetical protein [Chloroflexota bacterium]